jgi:hypothetical protein
MSKNCLTEQKRKQKMDEAHRPQQKPADEPSSDSEGRKINRSKQVVGQQRDDGVRRDEISRPASYRQAEQRDPS